jgi:predicted dehydrogenase
MMQYQREAAKRVRLGIVGVGSHAYRNILPTLTYLPVELVAVTDVDEAKAAQVAQQYGAKASYGKAADMYANEQLDGVLLVVSPHLHPDLAIEAFKAGVNVWMEKPAALRASRVTGMLAARGERVAVVGYKKAFMPAVRKTLELLALAENAPVRSVLGVYPSGFPEDGVRALETGESNEWLANGCHPLAAMLELGGKVSSVTTFRGQHDGAAVILQYASGAIGNLHLPKGVPTSQPFESYLVAAGSHSIAIDNARRLTYQRGSEFNYTYGTTFAAGGLDSGAIVWEAQDGLNTLENKAVFTQGVYNSLEHFASSILAGKMATIGTLEFAHHLTSVWEATLLSGGNRITL